MEQKKHRKAKSVAKGDRTPIDTYAAGNLKLYALGDDGPYVVTARRPGNGGEIEVYKTPCRDRAMRYGEVCLFYASVARTLEDRLSGIALRAVVALEELHGTWKGGKLALDRDALSDELERLYDDAVMVLDWPRED